jgi:hypothetical protein
MGTLIALAARDPARLWRAVHEPARGSRDELARATAHRLEAAIVVIVLAARCVHLGQATIDLLLAVRSYTVPWLAVALGGACLAESVILAVWVSAQQRLTRTAVLVDGAFGVVGLALMSAASSSGPGRAGSLNWMLPYTITTAAALGALAAGRLAASVPRQPGLRGHGLLRPNGASIQLAGVAVLLAAGYVASAYLPRRLPQDQPGQIWFNAANYVTFFAAIRNARVMSEAEPVAREGQWNAAAVDVFRPTISLFDTVAALPDGPVPEHIRQQAGHIMVLIDAVRPGDQESDYDDWVEG